MAWQDMGTYWAWRGGENFTPPPTQKRIVYLTTPVMKIACAVFDDDKLTMLNRTEVDELIARTVPGRQI